MLRGRDDAVHCAADGYLVTAERNTHHAAAHEQLRDWTLVAPARGDEVFDARAETYFEIARCRDRAARHGGHAARDGTAGLEVAKQRGRGARVLAQVADVRGLRERRNLVSGQRLDELPLAAGGVLRRHRDDGKLLSRVERRQRTLQRCERFRFVLLDGDDALLGPG